MRVNMEIIIYMWTVDEIRNDDDPLCESYKLKQLIKEQPAKIQAWSWTGVEPITSAIPVQHSNNWTAG